MSREDVVAYLGGYLAAASKREFFLELLQEAEEAGAEKGKLEELSRKAEREGRAMQDVLDRISRMGAETEKRVLFYRYVKGMKAAEIAERMSYSVRQVQRLCVHGLDLLAAEKG